MDKAVMKGWSPEVVRYAEPDDLNGPGHTVWRLIGGAENNAATAHTVLKVTKIKLDGIIQNGPNDETTLKMMTEDWPPLFEKNFVEAWRENEAVYRQQMATAAAQLTKSATNDKTETKIETGVTSDWHEDAGAFIWAILEKNNQLAKNDKREIVVSADFMKGITRRALVLTNAELWNGMMVGDKQCSPSIYLHAFTELGERFSGVKNSRTLESLQNRYKKVLNKFARRPVRDSEAIAAVGGSRYSNLIF